MLSKDARDEVRRCFKIANNLFSTSMPQLPDSIQVLHKVTTGRVHTLILKGEPKEAEAAMAATNPLLLDVLPLTLEEIFIYELGGVDYAVKDFLF